MKPPASVTASGGLARLYDGIEAILPGVQHPIVQMALWDAIEEFCTLSTAWRQNVVWTLAAGQLEYDLNPVDSTALATEILSLSGLFAYMIRQPAVIVATEVEDKPRQGTALVACKPSGLGGDLSFLLDNGYYEALRDGALSRLYAQPAKPYSAPQLATYHGQRFRDGIRRAKTQAVAAGRSSRAPLVRFPYFASGRRR